MEKPNLLIVNATPLGLDSRNINSPFVGTWETADGYVPSENIVYIDSIESHD